MRAITSTILKKLIKGSNQQILIPFYHMVTDEVPSFVSDLYPPRKVKDFKHDLEVLLKFYEPISLSELIKLVQSGEKTTENYFHLTFDDGLSNFYEIVAPILIEKKIPATIFLNSNFIDNKELFFRYKASLLFEHYKCSNDRIKNKYHSFVNASKDLKKNVSKYLFDVNYSSKEILDALAIQVNFNFSHFLNSENPYLSKKQIVNLIEKGFTFGAHSKDHPYYSELLLEEQLKQTSESLSSIINEFSINYKAFSFPFSDEGVSREFFKIMANDKLIDISFGTFGIKEDSVKNNLQRISFEFAPKNTRLFLLKKYIGYFLKIPFGKNVRKRKK